MYEPVQPFTSTLPADDDHPYRSGPWQPQLTEWSTRLEVVSGQVPKDLDGTYLRNTENPLHPPIGRYHPFDGDGLLHAVEFLDGQAAYWNRFVRTDGLRAEQEAGHALWAGFIESPGDARHPDGWGARTRMKDASSTDVIVHRGEALTSFYQCGDLYRLDLSPPAPRWARNNGAAQFPPGASRPIPRLIPPPVNCCISATAKKPRI